MIDWFANTMHSISTQCDRVEIDGLLKADSYKYTWISNKAYKDPSATLLPSVSVSNPGYSGLSHGENTGILESDRVNQDLQTTLYIGVSVSNPGYSGLSPKVYTGISVGDKVYKDLSATLYPKVLGYNSLSPYQNVGQQQGILISVRYTVCRYSLLSPGVYTRMPASVAQLGARQTWDQGVVSSIPVEVDNILSWTWRLRVQ